MVEIVPYEPVRHGRLRRGSLKRRMRIDRPDAGIKPRIRYSPQPHPAIVVRYVLHEVVDRVPGIRALIDVVRLQGVDDLRPVIYEYAFRMPPAADILVCENVSVVFEQ